MMTFAQLHEKFGPDIRAISVCVLDFRYGPREELDSANLWAVPSAGLVVSCVAGMRPLDSDAVKLSNFFHDYNGLGRVLTETARGAKAKGLVKAIDPSLLVEVTRKPAACVQRLSDGVPVVHFVDLASGDELEAADRLAPLMVMLAPEKSVVERVEDAEGEDAPASPAEGLAYRDIFAFDYDPAAKPRIELLPVAYDELLRPHAQFVFVLGAGASVVLEDKAMHYAAVLPNVDAGLSRVAFHLLSVTLAEALLKWEAGQVFISLTSVESLGEFVYEVDNWSASYAVFFVEPARHPGGQLAFFKADVSRLLELVKAKHAVEER